LGKQSWRGQRKKIITTLKQITMADLKALAETLVSLSVKDVQEQQQQIDALKLQNQKLLERLEKLEQK